MVGAALAALEQQLPASQRRQRDAANDGSGRELLKIARDSPESFGGSLNSRAMATRLPESTS
jgi:hypothetical protein